MQQHIWTSPSFIFVISLRRKSAIIHHKQTFIGKCSESYLDCGSVTQTHGPETHTCRLAVLKLSLILDVNKLLWHIIPEDAIKAIRATLLQLCTPVVIKRVAAGSV